MALNPKQNKMLHARGKKPASPHTTPHPTLPGRSMSGRMMPSPMLGPALPPTARTPPLMPPVRPPVSMPSKAQAVDHIVAMIARKAQSVSNKRKQV